MAHPRSDLFEYTSARWIVNDELCHAERRRDFNVDGLCRLAAESVQRSPDDIDSLRKITEDGYVTTPKYFAAASEVTRAAIISASAIPTSSPNNIIVSWTPDSNSYVSVGLIDWQRAPILPLSLQAGISKWLQNFHDAGWQPMTRLSLPEDLDNLKKPAAESGDGVLPSPPPPLLLC